MSKSDVCRLVSVVIFFAAVSLAPRELVAQETGKAIIPPSDAPVSANSPTAMPVPAAPAASPAKPQPTHEELGDSLMLHKRYQAAIEEYAKAPVSAVVWNKMGIVYQMLFNLKDAERCYKESLKLNSSNPTVLNNLATVDDSLKDYRAAEKLYRKALKIDPHSALVLKNLGTNLLSQHKNEKGWRAYQQALAIDPQIFQDRDSPEVQNVTSVQQRGAMNYYMALGCAQAGHVECALEYLRMALNEGYTSPKKIASDVAFSSLKDNPEFKQLLAEQESTKTTQDR